MSTTENPVQHEQPSVPFGRALVFGAAKITFRVALFAAAVQALYALGWGFAKLVYAWVGGESPPPPTIWIGAKDASPLNMLGAGVASLIVIAGILAAVLFIAHTGGWRGLERRLTEGKDHAYHSDREIS